MEISAAEFKAKCLKLMDEIARTRKPIVITKRGKPVARIVPAGQLPAKPKLDLFALQKFRADLPAARINSAEMVRKMRAEADGW